MNRLTILALGSLGIVLVISATVYIYRADLDWLKRNAAETPITEQAAREALKGMPLVFQENKGQVDAQVKYLVRNGATSMFFAESEIVYQLLEPSAEQVSSDRLPSNEQAEDSKPQKAVALRQTFVGGLTPYSVQGEGELKSKVNYFIGNDESKWVRGASTYAGVRYAQIYKGIDVVYDGSLGRLDYRFELQPGANPDDIHVKVEGADSLALAADGALVFVTPLGNMGLPKPRATQNGKSIAGVVQYRLIDDTTFAIELGTYDQQQPLIITTSQ